MIVARLPCLPLVWRYHLRPALRHARRGIRVRTLFGVVPLVLFVWLGYGGYFVAVQQGQLAVPLLELRLSMLGYFAVAFVLRTRHPRSAVLFHATTPTELSPNLRLQAVANMATPAGYAVLFLAFALPVVLRALPSALDAVLYLAADASLLAVVVSHLSLGSIVSGLAWRVRLAWATAVILLVAAEIGACALWPAANGVVLAVNAALLAASWSNGVRAWNPVTLYRAMIRRLARSQRQPLVALVTRRLPVERSVYARTFLFTPYGVLSCLAAYGFVVAAGAELSAHGMPVEVPATLILAYLATAGASSVFQIGLHALPLTFYKLTPVSFGRLTGHLVLPHLVVLAPITVIALALELTAGGSLATAGLLILQTLWLPLLAWCIAVRHLHRHLLPALLYAFLVTGGLVAAVVMPWLFVGLSALVLWFMYRGASDRYLVTVADEWLEPNDSV